MSEWTELPLGDQVLGECPRWDPYREELVWVDVFQGVVAFARLDRDGAWSAVVRHSVGPLVTAVAASAAATGGWWVATGKDVVVLSRSGRVTPAFCDVSRDYPAVRTNDMVTDSRGRLLVGLLAEDRISPCASLEGVSERARQRTLVPGMVTANGLALSLDEHTLYLVDSVLRRLSAYPYDIASGTVGQGRVLVDWPCQGTLDGMAVGPDGDLWVAIWDGGELRRFGPNGVLRDIIPTPVPRPTAVAFAGSDRQLLVITSARADLSRVGGELGLSKHGRLYARQTPT